MKVLPPVPWSEVTPGAVIMDHNGVARTVLDIRPTRVADLRLAFIEGLPPYNVIAERFIAVVELEESDAITSLLHAGFTVTPITQE